MPPDAAFSQPSLDCPEGFARTSRFAFFAPGANSANTINASKVTPSFLLYRRIAPVPGPRAFF